MFARNRDLKNNFNFWWNREFGQNETHHPGLSPQTGASFDPPPVSFDQLINSRLEGVQSLVNTWWQAVQGWNINGFGSYRVVRISRMFANFREVEVKRVIWRGNDFTRRTISRHSIFFLLLFQRRIRSKDFCGKVEQKFRPEIEMNEHLMSSTFLKRVRIEDAAENRYLEVGK